MRRESVIFTSVAVIQRSLGFLLLPFVTGAMSVAEYGRTSILVSVAAILGILFGNYAEAATYSAAARRFGEESAAVLTWMQLIMLLVVPVLGTIGGLLVIATDFSLFDIPPVALALELVAVPLLSASLTIGLALMRSRSAVTGFLVFTGVSIAAQIIGKLYFVVALQLGAVGWALSDLLIGSGCYVIAFVWILKKERRTALTRSSLAALTRYALPIAPQQLLYSVMGVANRPLMAIVAPIAAVGVFGLAANVATAAMVVLSEVNRAVQPEYARDTGGATLLKTGRTQVLVAFLAAWALSVGAIFLVPVLFDIRYEAATGLSGILAIGVLAHGLYLLPENMLILRDKRSDLSWISTGVGAVVLLTLIAPLGWLMAAPGVAIATSAAYVGMAFAALVVSRRVRWRPLPIRPLPTGALASAVGLASSATWAEGAAQLVLVLCSTAALVGGLALARRSA